MLAYSSAAHAAAAIAARLVRARRGVRSEPANRPIVPTFARLVANQGASAAAAAAVQLVRGPLHPEAAMAGDDHILAIDHRHPERAALLFDPQGTSSTRRGSGRALHLAAAGLGRAGPGDLLRSLGEAWRQLWAASSVPKEAVAGSP